MKLNGFWKTEKEKEAENFLKQTNHSPEDLKELGRRKRQKIDVALNMTRRRFLRLAASGSGLTFILGSGLYGLYEYLSREENTENLNKKDINNINKEKSETDTDQISENSEFLDPAEVREIYNQGFDMIMNSIPDTPPEGANFFAAFLSTVKLFRKNMTRWVELQGDSYIALEDGFKNFAWLCAMPPDSQHTRDMIYTLQLDPKPENNILKIKPAAITKTWAGLGLIHELSHLFDRVLHLESPTSRGEEFFMGELRAFMAELGAANHHTKGKFSLGMGQVLDKYNISGSADLYKKIHSGDEIIFEKINEHLDPIITEERALSLDERGLRNGFYQIVLGFEAINKENNVENDYPGELRNEYLKVIKYIYQNQGQICEQKTN